MVRPSIRKVLGRDGFRGSRGRGWSALRKAVWPVENFAVVERRRWSGQASCAISTDFQHFLNPAFERQTFRDRDAHCFFCADLQFRSKSLDELKSCGICDQEAHIRTIAHPASSTTSSEMYRFGPETIHSSLRCIESARTGRTLVGDAGDHRSNCFTKSQMSGLALKSVARSATLRQAWIRTSDF